jgi:polyhydroxyalkanoate synthesis regulator phasin
MHKNLFMVILKFRMLNKRQSIQTSLLVSIIIIVQTFFFVVNIIPILALHEEQQILNNYDDLQGFADAVKNGDEQLEDIPLESMEASDIYGDADESLQDCIELAAEVGDSLTDKEVVHCVDDANYFKNKYSTNSSVPITTTTNTTTGTTASTGTNGTSNSNVISIADDDENKLINELVKTGKFTEDEATEFVTKVNLINELVKTGKFTEDEATQLVTKVINNGTNVDNVPEEVNMTANIPEVNMTANIPEVNITEPEVPEEVNITEPEVPEEVNITEPEVPEEVNITANIPQEVNVTANIPEEVNVTANIPEEVNVTANIPEEVNVTEPEVPQEVNVTANIPEVNVTEPEVPQEVNVTANIPEVNVTEPEVPQEVNIPQDNISNLVNLNISVKQNPISPGGEQTVTLTASNPNTGDPLHRIFVHLTIKDPSGNVVKDYTDNDGNLSPTFVIGENEVGTFTVLGAAFQAGVESNKSLTFQVR